MENEERRLLGELIGELGKVREAIDRHARATLLGGILAGPGPAPPDLEPWLMGFMKKTLDEAGVPPQPPARE